MTMTPSAVQAAARALVEARRSRKLLAGLPADARPQSIADAHAIQDATVAALAEKIAGWKVSVVDGEVMRGVLIGSRVQQSPAHFSAAEVPMLGVEAEIAAAVTALAAIEVVDTRFANYADTPVIDRLADFISNGGFVTGTVWPD